MSEDFPGNRLLDQQPPRPTFTHIGRSALGYPEVLPPTAKREASYLGQIQKARKKLLTLETNTEGLNMQRLTSYAEEMGAAHIPLLFLNPADYAKAIAATIGKLPYQNEMNYGVYLSEVGVCAIKRDPVMEALNGTAWTEAAAVHELGHGTAEFRPVEIGVRTEKGRVLKKNVFYARQKRHGFLVGKPGTVTKYDRGSFLEEGYAEYERGQYVQRLGNQDGVLIEDPRLLEDFAWRRIGPHYWWLTGGEVGRTIPLPSSLPAATLELMIKEDAELLTALRSGRRSAEGLREVARRVNAFEPGLYQKMQAANVYTEEGLVDTAAIYGHVAKKLR